MYSQNSKYVVTLSLLAVMAYSLPQVNSAMADAVNSSFSISTANTAAVAQAAAVSQVSVSDMNARVTYNSGHNESGITVTSKVKVTAAGSDLTIAPTSFGSVLMNKTLNIQGPFVWSSSVTSNIKKNNDGSYTIKRGTTATFTATGQTTTSSMIAGQYYASLKYVIASGSQLSAPTNKSNTIVVVGEASPYITLVGQGVYGLKDTVIVNGVRLGTNASVAITPAYSGASPYSKTFTLKLKNKATQFSFKLADYGVPPGSYSLQVTNTDLGNVSGRSDIVGFTVFDQDKLITASVNPGKLALAYDSSHQESALSAPFTITVKAGKSDLTFDNGFGVIATSPEYSVGATSVVQSINKAPPVLPYILKAGKEATFVITSAINPKFAFPGSYTMSLTDIYATKNGGAEREVIQIPSNTTNAVVIIGEQGPVITNVTSPVSPGASLIISGYRLGSQNGPGTIFIDGTQLSGVVFGGPQDGTSLSFNVPASFTNGYHQISVTNGPNGSSNTSYFLMTGGVDVTPPPPTCPVGYICVPVGATSTCPTGFTCTVVTDNCPDGYTCTNTGTSPILCNGFTFTTNLIVGSTGPDVVALQTWLIANGYNIPNIMNGSTAKGYFDAQTQSAVAAYQTAHGITSTGLVDASTRASLNSSCSIPTTGTCPTGYVCTPGTATSTQPTNCPTGFTCTTTPVQGQVITLLDSSSPINGLVQISKTAQTNNIVLAIFDIKSQYLSSTLHSINLSVNTTGAGISTVFSNLQIRAAGLTYSANSLGALSSFTNLAIPLPADTYIPVTVLGTVAADASGSINGSSASVTLLASSYNMDVEDSSFGHLGIVAATSTGSTLTFSSSNVLGAGPSTTYGNSNSNPNTGSTTQQFTWSIGLTAGNNPIYISKNAATAFTTSAVPAGMAISNVNFSDNDTSGDGSAYFYIAPGQTKTFTSIYMASGLMTAAGTYQVNAINYGTTTSGVGSTLGSSDITNGLKAVLFH